MAGCAQITCDRVRDVVSVRRSASNSMRIAVARDAEAGRVIGRPRPTDGYPCAMSQIDRAAVKEALDQLRPDDRVWLEERLAEYETALQYLHDH